MRALFFNHGASGRQKRPQLLRSRTMTNCSPRSFRLAPPSSSSPSFTPPTPRSCTPTTRGDCERLLSASSARYVAGIGPHFVSIFWFNCVGGGAFSFGRRRRRRRHRRWGGGWGEICNLRPRARFHRAPERGWHVCSLLCACKRGVFGATGEESGRRPRVFCMLGGGSRLFFFLGFGPERYARRRRRSRRRRRRNFHTHASFSLSLSLFLPTPQRNDRSSPRRR